MAQHPPTEVGDDHKAIGSPRLSNREQEEESLAQGFMPLWMPEVFKDKPGVYCGPFSATLMYWSNGARCLELSCFPAFSGPWVGAINLSLGGDILFYGCWQHRGSRMLWVEVPVFLSVWAFFFQGKEFLDATTWRKSYFKFEYWEVFDNWEEATETREEELTIADTLLSLHGYRLSHGQSQNIMLEKACRGWLKQRQESCGQGNQVSEI